MEIFIGFVIYLLIGIAPAVFIFRLVTVWDAEDYPNRYPNGPVLDRTEAPLVIVFILLWPIAAITASIMGIQRHLRKRRKTNKPLFATIVSRLTRLPLK